MSEDTMVHSVEAALHSLGVQEQVTAAGQFQPRGHTGSMFAGGMIGDSLAGALGSPADSVATVGGALAGARMHDAASGLPTSMLVAVTATHVYGFAAAHRSSPVGALVFGMPRDRIEVKVHQRVNVRVLELVDGSTGSAIQLEGNRIPLTHSKDVIDALRE
ncbi:hypothetical protein KRR39_09410 [Nocardioides panacis]|uniref:Uncharacterized protein n=1 Tax=Nocardioides panacis TaxID=2849501 RepID=A0A975Y1Z3_9ACTN|nr:hypothetical protein [Nocardioides panacis]QWZ09919.1 hypothetical protein KRR39_09410 [Nocardioides panacis]